MKKFYSILTLITFFAGSMASQLIAQCANNNTLLTFATAPSVIGASTGAQIGCIYPGEFIRVSGLQAGSTYRISACGSDAGLDTRLTIYPSSGGAAVGFNDDFCGLASRIDFTPSSTGSYDILLDQTGANNTCISNTTDCGQIIVTLIGNGAGLGYCTPTYTAGTTGGDFINGVSLGTINNQNTGSSSGPAYTFYSNISTSLNFSTSYTLSIKNNPTYQERVAAWIDYNGDFTFTSDERLGQIVLSPNQLGTINFTTPASGIAGATRLRVRQVFTIPSGSFIDPCGSATVGETEDYVINLPSSPQGPQIGDSFSTTCGLGLSIPDNTCPNNTLASISVSGLANLGTTKELKSVELTIIHPMAADLDLFLESPTGQIVLLSSDNGGSGADYGAYSLNDCSQTALFRMTASTSITAATAPFIGSFIPEGNLNDFNSGINPNGIWKLRACDDFSGDVGTIQFFRINFGNVVSELPSCASNFNILNGASNQPTNTTISWSAGSGSPTSYDVYFGTDLNPSLVSNNQLGTTYNPGVLTPSTTYYYKVIPSNSTGDATDCETRSFSVVSPATGILMSNGSVDACSGNFYDSGANLSNYSNGESFVLTINPSTSSSAVQVDFSTFVLADGDELTVYDGTDINAASLGVFTSSNVPNILTATNIDGALTFSFASDNILNAAGWEAEISCVPLSLVPGCATSLSPVANATAVDINSNISWSPTTGDPSSYDVFFGTIPNPPFAATSAVTSYEPGELLPSTTYFYKISPVNVNGSNALCDVLSFTTADVVSTSITIADSDQTICSAVFTDTGDLTGDYQNDEDQTITFTPDVPGNLISVTFNQFSTEEDFDILTVYNGNSTSGAVLGALSGELTSSVTFLSDAPDGSLTFQFISDFQNANAGWNATISCVPNTEVPPCAINTTPTDGLTNLSISTTFAWESGGGAPTGYDFLIGTSVSNLTLVGDNISSTEFTPISPLESNTTYFWQVIPSNLNGAAIECPIYSFTTAAPQAEDVVITNGSDTLCAGIFTDSGGQNGNYSDNEVFIYTIFPETQGNSVQLDFTQVDIDQTGTDGMVLINGSDPFFGQIIGLVTEPTTITSTAPDGALTIIFSSDASANGAGWAATISCIESNAAPLCILDYLPFNGATDQQLTTQLTWTPNSVGGVPETYDVYFGTDAFNLPLVSDNQIGTNYSPLNLTQGTEYFWQVIPANSVGEATFCGINSFVTGVETVTDVIMANDTAYTCGGNFYDSGGLNGEYSADENLLQVICPSSPNSAIKVTFTSFDVEDAFDPSAPYDALSIYSGMNTSGTAFINPVSGNEFFYGENVSIGSFTSGSVDGCLTFAFFSDILTFNGWEATIECVSTSSPANCAINSSPSNLANNVTTSANLSWEPSLTGVTSGYDIFFGNSINTLTQVGTDISATTFDLPVLEPSTTYYYQIVPYNNSGSATSCLINSFTTTSQVAIIISNDTIYTCNANFYDSGGPNGNYTAGENFEQVICPSTPNSAIQATFLSFDVEPAFIPTEPYDALVIYSGMNSLGTPFINPANNTEFFYGENVSIGSFTSNSEDGCLTFVFFSDIFTYNGWEATISCVQTDIVAECATNTSPSNLATNVSTASNLSWAPGEGVTVGYNVFFGTDPDALVQVATEITETTFDLPVLDPNTTYYYQIVPYNNVGNAVGCLVNSFTTSETIDVLMTDGSITTCNANFYDDGGIGGTATTSFAEPVPAGNYSNIPVQVFTFFPSTPNSAIQAAFTSFNVETTYDELNVYNGADINSPLLGSFTGLVPIGTFTSSDISGALTFEFFSDGSGTRAGWEAAISCVSTSEPAACATNSLPTNTSTGVSTASNLSWSAGQGVTVGYNVFFGTDPDALVQVATEITETNFDLPSLDPGTTYYYQIVPYNNVGSATGCLVNSFITSETIDVLMTEGSVTTCNANFYDMGGPGGSVTATSTTPPPSGNYSNSVDQTFTILPSSPNSAVQVTFNTFGIEDTYEYLTIYNGPDNTFPQIPGSPFTGTDNPGTIVSTDASGALTFNFTSDDSFTWFGWDADVSCVLSGIPADCATNFSPVDLSTNVSTISSLSWSQGSVITSAYNVYLGTDPNNMELVFEDLSTPNYIPGSLLPNTTYYWTVIPFNSFGLATGCDTLSFTTAAEVTYCDAAHGGVVTLNCGFGQEYISNVNIGTINNPSACVNAPAYTDFTSLSTNVTQGTNVPATFTIGNYFTTDRVIVWVDWNQDGDFIDAGELSGNFLTPGAGSVGGNIVVPAGAALGETRLRARLFYGNPTSFDPCGIPSNGYGETEDYTVVVQSLTEPPVCSTNLIPANLATNIAPNQVVLTWTNGGGAATYDVYFGTDPDALVLVSDNQVGTSYNPGALELNTSYYWQIIPSNSVGTNATCPVTSFTTSGSVDIIMADGLTVTTCTANFYDMGGPGGSTTTSFATPPPPGNYSNGVNQTLTILPGSPNSAIQVTFNTFGIENNFDFLRIYNGPNNTFPQIAGSPFTNTNSPGTVTSTHPSGALTFNFTSDGSVHWFGWDATVSCASTTNPAVCATNFSPANSSTNVSTASNLSWTPGVGSITVGYNVFFGTDPDALVQIATAITATNYDLPPLDPSTTYYYQIVPTNNVGSATGCIVNSFTTSSTVDILMFNGSITTCDANFYDMGGQGGSAFTVFQNPPPPGNYTDNVDQTLTIFPSTPNSLIQVDFNTFGIENNFDFLTIFDGPDNSYPEVAGSPFTGANNPGIITSSDSSGALTFNFSSDGVINWFGWEATVSCISALDPPSCVTYTSGPLDGDTGVCVNETGFAWISGSGTPATSYDVYFDLGGGLQLLSPGQTETAFDPGLLSPNTTYSYQVVALNSNGPAVDCPVITFTTGTCLNYCDAGSQICDEYIENVTFGSINNSSDCSDGLGYANYTNLSTNLYLGSSQAITVNNGTAAYTQDQCGIWVDWNQDGDFGDAGETITVTGTPGTGPYTANIIPPADALLGATTIRIRIAYVGVVDPCGTPFFGEVEDYTIIVNPALACPFPNNITLSEVSTTSAVVSWDEQPDALQYLLRYKLVSEPTSVPTWSAPIQIDSPLIFTFLQGLETCEDYVLQIASICDDGSLPPPPGGGIDTIYSSEVYFGTRCIECTPDMTAENETCPIDANGTCQTAQPISCGETVCATTFYSGFNRDLDWYSFNVPTDGIYSIELTSDFLGLVQLLNVDDCSNPIVISQGNYQASSNFTLASSLSAGNYAFIVTPDFNQSNIVCDNFNQYTVTLLGSSTQIAPVDPVCVSTAPFDLFAIPSGGTWSGTGITSTSNGTFDPSVAGIGSFVVTYNSTANGCSGSDTITIVVSGATNTAPAQPVGTDSLCVGASNTVYNVTPLTGITNYVWVLTPTEAGTITGTSASATVQWSPVYIGSASIVVAANSSCGLSEFSTSLNIEIAPVAQAPSAIQGSSTSCSVSETYFSTESAGSELVWTIAPTNAGTLSPNGNSVVITWADAFIGSATLTAINTNFCGSSQPTTLTINVLGSPFADFVGLAASYCTSEQAAVLTGIPSGGYFSSDPVGAVTGNVFNPSVLTSGSYDISYTVEVDGCLGTNTQTVAVVSGAATTLNIVPASVCNNSAEIVLSGTGAPAGGVYAGPGVVNGIFNPSQVQPGAVTITYTIAGSTGTCPGFASQAIQVNPSPVINLVGLAPSYCLNSEPVELEGVPALGTFSGPGVATGIFTPSNAGLGAHVLTYSFDNGTCVGLDQVSVEVTPNITVSFVGVPSSVCSNANPITLVTNPAGATFSGPGVSGNKFDPNIAGIGSHTITATLNQGTCSATATAVINVIPSPVANFNFSLNGATVTMINSSTNATSYAWTFGDGGTSTAENPSHTYVTNGNFTVTLIASGSNVNCNADTISLTLGLSVGIGSIEGMDMVQLYPNPTSGDVNLSLNSLNAQSFEIRITDATGRLIANEATTNFLGKFNRIYDLGDKAKGVYFFTITSEKGAMNFRVVRN